MRNVTIIVIIIVALCSCTYTPVITEETNTANENSTYSPLSATKDIITNTATATPSPTVSPIPTPFERKNVMTSPRILIKKSERMLYVYDEEILCAKIQIALGSSPEGHKKQEGDRKTPEGEYYICTKNDKSKYYLSLAISYPNIQDAQSGLDNGLIAQSEYEKIESAINNGKRPPWDTALGGEIMIHGSDASYDWTAGCIAAEETDIDYLWENCPVGTPVTILP